MGVNGLEAANMGMLAPENLKMTCKTEHHTLLVILGGLVLTLAML